MPNDQPTAPAPIGAPGTVPDARAALAPLRNAVESGHFFLLRHDIQAQLIVSLIRHAEGQSDVLRGLSDSINALSRRYDTLAAKAAEAGVTVPTTNTGDHRHER